MVFARHTSVRCTASSPLADTLGEGPGGVQGASHLVIDGIGNLVLCPPPRNAKIHVFGCLIAPVRAQEEATHFSPAVWLLVTEWFLGARGHVGSFAARWCPRWAQGHQGSGPLL